MKNKPKSYSSSPVSYPLILLMTFLWLVPECIGKSEIRDPETLRSTLNEIRLKYKLPAVTCSVVLHGRVIVASAVGVRKWGEDIPVTRDDPFLLGSITKPMTGTLIGILIDQDILKFDTTIMPQTRFAFKL